MIAMTSNSPIEYHIDKVINTCATYIERQSSFESIRDPLIASLLKEYHMENILTRTLFRNLFDDFICKYYGSDYAPNNVDNCDEIIDLSRLLMDGYNTYYFSDHVDICFRAFISRAVASEAMKCMYN